jgi:hypothetical protein
MCTINKTQPFVKPCIHVLYWFRGLISITLCNVKSFDWARTLFSVRYKLLLYVKFIGLCFQRVNFSNAFSLHFLMLFVWINVTSPKNRNNQSFRPTPNSRFYGSPRIFPKFTVFEDINDFISRNVGIFFSARWIRVKRI